MHQHMPDFFDAISEYIFLLPEHQLSANVEDDSVNRLYLKICWHVLAQNRTLPEGKPRHFVVIGVAKF